MKQYDLNLILEYKDIKPKYRLDQWKKSMLKKTEREIRSAILIAMNNAAHDMDKIGAVTAMFDKGRGNSKSSSNIGRFFKNQDEYKKAVEYIVRETMRVASKSIDRKVAIAKAKIDSDVKKGVSRYKLMELINGLTSKDNAWSSLLIDNLKHSAHEASRNALVKQSGDVVDKMWLSKRDKRVRLTHRIADGQTRSINSNFRVGGTWMQAPGDPRGGAKECAGCRCKVVYRLKPRHNRK